MRVRIQTTPTGRGGDCLYQFFLLGNKWQLVIFQGQVRGPCPLCQTVWIYISTTYQGLSIPESLDICIAGPGQFTNRLLIISADVKGKDSMIL